MLSINGSLEVLPLGISTDVGKISIDGAQQAAVVQTFLTESGPVAVVIPTTHVDQVIEGLKESKERADADASDIYIPGSDNEVQEIAQGFDKINEGKK